MSTSKDLAKQFNLRRSKLVWRGDCPRPACDGIDSFTLTFNPTPEGHLRARCRVCDQFELLKVDDPPWIEINGKLVPPSNPPRIRKIKNAKY